MGLGGIAAAVGAAVSLASLGYSLSQSPPNLNQGNAQAAGVLAQAQTLPWQRAYQAAAQQGGIVTKEGYTQTTESAIQRQQLQSQLDQVNAAIARAQKVANPTPWEKFQLGQQQQQAQQLQDQIKAIPEGGGTVYTDAKGNIVPASEATVDFSGFGAGQVQGELASQMAQIQDQLQQKYGVQFAQEAKDQLALSDPQGTAAREKLYQLIEQQNQQPWDQPVADLLDKQITAQVESGNKLDPAQRALLDQAVAQAQADRGQDAGADTQQFATPLETGFEGQQRALAAANKATAWLGSGSTPEDVQYRHEQQNLSNLGSFINGQTPEAQFANLSGAQKGTTPQYFGQPLTQATGQAGATSQAYTTAGYLQNLKYQQSQANSWMAGLSSSLNMVGALNSMGAFGGAGGG